MLLLLLLDGWMSIENKIPTSLRKSQQVKADCSCWMKSMNLETASLPLDPLSPLLLPHCFLFSFARKEKWEICHDFSWFHNLHQLLPPLIYVFFFCCCLSGWISANAGRCYAKLVIASKNNKSTCKSRRWEDYWPSFPMQFYRFYKQNVILMSSFFFFCVAVIWNHNQQSSREKTNWVLPSLPFCLFVFTTALCIVCHCASAAILGRI